jgi:hypothetical protein
MPEELRYFLINNNGQTYDNDANGNLITTPSPVALENTPDGWQETAIQYGRSSTYFGIIRAYTVPLGFVREGARIVRQLFYGTTNVEAVASIAISKYDHLQMKYKRFFNAALNFATFNDGSDIVEIQVTEGDLSMMIKANEGTTYEIDVDVPEALTINMDGLILYSIVSAINYAHVVTIDGEDVPDIITAKIAFLGMSVVNTETKYPSIIWADVTGYRTADSLDYDPNDWLMDVKEPVTVQAKGSIVITLLEGGTAYRMGLYVRSGANARIIDIIPNTPYGFPGPDTPLELPFDLSFDLLPGERVWPFFEHDGDSPGKVFSIGTDSKIDFTYNYRGKPTNIQWLRGLYIFQQLISKITNDKYNAASTFLENTKKDFVLTCGDALRGFRTGTPVDYEGPKIKTSLRDFFQSYNASDGIGLGIEGDTARIELKSYFYQPVIVASIGLVSDLKIRVADDYIFNTVKVGWPEQTYDDVNGRNEFNNTHTYTTPIKRVTKELDLTSKYRADPYGIEFTRINLQNTKTTDSASDNDVFMLNIADNGTGGYIINRPNYDTLTGVLAGNSIFNVELSPNRCLIGNGAQIHSGLDGHENEYLVFQTTEKSRSLLTVDNGITIEERADYLIGNLPAKLYLPYLFVITCKSPVNVVDLIEGNPYGEIEFEEERGTFRGFIIEAGQQAANDAQQTFTLLASANNDMKKLIK